MNDLAPSVASSPSATVLLLRSDPQASAFADEAFDPAFVLAAFDQPVTVIFADAGRARLFESAVSTAVLSATGAALLSRLAEFGLADIRVCDPPAELPDPVQALDRAELRELLARAARVLGD
jgi:sulfur relay (sulfurtransferase) DsrF/TusC family protein